MFKLNKISNEVIDFMLEPYFLECRYLKEASIEYGQEDSESHNLLARGRFEISSCCYGNGPGHFNATEFFICFNQLTYVFLADGIEKKLMPELEMDSMEDFKKIQMEGSYIAKIKDVVFKKPINSNEFYGQVDIDAVKSIGKNNFYYMNALFEDSFGGNAKGSLIISIIK